MDNPCIACEVPIMWLAGVAVAKVDSVGRRPLLLGGVSAMVVALLALGAAELLLTGRVESYTSVAALLLYVGAYQARSLQRVLENGVLVNGDCGPSAGINGAHLSAAAACEEHMSWHYLPSTFIASVHYVEACLVSYIAFPEYEESV